LRQRSRAAACCTPHDAKAAASPAASTAPSPESGASAPPSSPDATRRRRLHPLTCPGRVDVPEATHQIGLTTTNHRRAPLTCFWGAVPNPPEKVFQVFHHLTRGFSKRRIVENGPVFHSKRPLDLGFICLWNTWNTFSTTYTPHARCARAREGVPGRRQTFFGNRCPRSRGGSAYMGHGPLDATRPPHDKNPHSEYK